MVAAIFALFGLIVGSFLNVLIIRHGARTLLGRSACMACGRQLRSYDMVPVVSWLALRGRCRACHSRISIQYPLVEAVTGTLFAFIGASELQFLPQVLACAILALLITISVYDLRHTIIPDAWVWSFNLLALLFAFSWNLAPGTWHLAILAGPIAALPLFALWLFSRGAWMGLGDAKLALGIGWLLGPTLGIVSIFFAFVIGALVSAPLVLLSSEGWRKFVEGFTPTPISRRLVWGFTMKSEIPFGPFLIAACLIVWFALLYNVSLPQPLMLYE